MSGENGRLIQRLHRLYGNPPIRDGFRNGKATVRQIEQAITQKKDSSYWHVHIERKNNDYVLHLKKDHKNINVTNYLMK